MATDARSETARERLTSEDVGGMVATKMGSRVMVNVRMGECQHKTLDEHPCSFTARYFAVNESGGVIAMCGAHVPEMWFEDDFEPTVFDAHELTCEKHKQNRDFLPEEVGVGEEVCGAQAALLLVYPGEDGQYPFPVCFRHAREPWLLPFVEDEDDAED